MLIKIYIFFYNQPTGTPLKAAEALQRLQQIQAHLVGGERANDKALKEKRAKRKKLAEKKILALASEYCSNMLLFYY